MNKNDESNDRIITDKIFKAFRPDKQFLASLEKGYDE